MMAMLMMFISSKEEQEANPTAVINSLKTLERSLSRKPKDVKYLHVESIIQLLVPSGHRSRDIDIGDDLDDDDDVGGFRQGQKLGATSATNQTDVLDSKDSVFIL
jgi:hypothetical protein